MPKPTLSTVRQSLGVARVALSGAAISLEHVISHNQDDRPGDPITPEIAMLISLDQQANWIVVELEHAIAEIRKAQEITAELTAPAMVKAEVAAELERAA